MADTILLIEDDEALGAQIVRTLEEAGYDCLWWREGHHIPAEAPPDVALVVLDLMMPRVPGMDMLRELRVASDVPVLVLSARNGTPDKVHALRLGADDYMTKPFWPEELIERVRARIRRPLLARDAAIEVGPVRVDVGQRAVWVHGAPVELTPGEFEFLLALVRRPGVAITRRWLAERVLDPDREGSERALDVHASRLRRKVGADLIETVWGVGYRLAVEAP
ncbi:MAG: response regulator transcription factor [Alphaproteobacteria bacterium]|nr:response regulator transcription factor [Alphaproteobacteria bacterium]